MKYETPELKALTSAINAIQSTSEKNINAIVIETYNPNDPLNEVVAHIQTGNK